MSIFNEYIAIQETVNYTTVGNHPLQAVINSHARLERPDLGSWMILVEDKDSPGRVATFWLSNVAMAEVVEAYTQQVQKENSDEQ